MNTQQKPLHFKEAQYVIDGFRFKEGTRIDQLRLAYFTMGTKKLSENGQITNAVLLFHNTTGAGQTWLSPSLADHLFGPGQALDLTQNFCIVPDLIGFGGSSKPSDGLRARFPNYRYDDMITATRQLLSDALDVEHLRLVLGLSMGGMLTWMWGTTYPGTAGALVPVSCQPGPMSGRNWLQRRIAIEAIRNDPEWANGDYEENPSRYVFTAPFTALMTQSVLRLQSTAPSREDADRYYQTLVEKARAGDANDVLYRFESSMDYDPSPDLNKITDPLLTINFADDAINPPELGVVDAAVSRLPGARAVLIPASAETYGHYSALYANLWCAHLEGFLGSIGST